MSDETLFLKGEVSIDDTGTVTGMAWPFGAPDSVGDVIEPGAFSFSNTVPMLLEHKGQAVGIWDSFAETDKGLEVKGRLHLDAIDLARDARRNMKSGIMKGLSIRFRSRDYEPRPEGGRVFKSVTVTEISLCRTPINRGARITIVKSEKGNSMENELENKPEAKADPVVTPEEVKALKAEIATEKARVDKLEAKANRSIAANGNHPAGENDNLEMKALTAFARTGDLTELKAAATDNDPAGGYFVLPTVDTRIRALMKDLSPLRALAEVVPVTGGGYERFYSLGKRGARRVSERDDRPQDTARPELIKHSYGTGEYYASPTTTRQQLDDSSMDVASWLINNAIQDFAETEGEDFLTGDGLDGFPKGLLTYATTNEKDFVRAWGTFQYVPAGHASAPTDKQLSDALIKLVATLRKPYKANAVFLMNGSTAVRLRQIVDASNRYLWAPTGNLIEGIEHPLFGYRVEIDDGMPDIGENAFPVAFGDFSQGYVIVDRQGIRAEQDTLTQKGRVIFDTYKRVGGGAGDFNAIKFLKIAAA